MLHLDGSKCCQLVKSCNMKSSKQSTGKKLQAALVGVNSYGYRVGESHHRAKLSDADVELILYLREAGLSFAEIAGKFDDGYTVSKSTVRDVCSGRIRGQAPQGWKKGA